MDLDHFVLHTTDPAASIRFYDKILGFRHEGRTGPFDVLRVGPGLTIDLMRVAAVHQPGHFAFSMPPGQFDRIVAQLQTHGVAYGPFPFDRSGGDPQPHAGARGLADALYFHDPDRHNIEVRKPPAVAESAR